MTSAPLEEKIPRGLAWLSWSLLVYSGSALLTSLGAWLFVAAINAYASQDPSTGGLNVGGFVAVYAGLGLASIALACLALGFRDMHRGIALLEPEDAATILLSRNVLFAACFAAVLGGLTIPVAFFSRSPVQLSASLAFLLFFTTSAASMFLACVSIPVLRFTRNRDRSMALFALALGAGGIVGESAMSVVGLVTSTNGLPNWVVYGGWPLLNLSVLFGPAVAVSALVMSRLYRYLASAWTQATSKEVSIPPRSSTGPTGLP